MRFFFSLVMLVLLSITSSLIVRQLGLFPQNNAQSAGSTILFVNEPAFELRCGPFASGADVRDVLAIVGGAGRPSGCDGMSI